MFGLFLAISAQIAPQARRDNIAAGIVVLWARALSVDVKSQS